jgi:hypothetical protein
MIYEVWRFDDGAAIVEAGAASNRAIVMQEPNARLVRRIEAASSDMLNPDDEMEATRPDDLNLPARQFQISVYSNGTKFGDEFEVKKQYRIEKPGSGSYLFKAGTRYRVIEGDIQAPDLIVMRCMSDEWSQFHLIHANSHDWTNYEKKASKS